MAQDLGKIEVTVQRVAKAPFSPPLVSILLPTFNRANLLEECVDSIMHQAYPHWELLIYDDGSTDNTTAVAKRLVRKDKNIRYYRNQTRKGLPETRNLAISASRSEFVFFVEDDLVLEPHCLTILVDTYLKLVNKGAQVGAVAPRMITTHREPTGPLAKVFDYLGDSRREKMHLPCEIDPLTGIIYRNYHKDFDRIYEVDDVHACSLFPRNIFNHVGGYSRLYKGNYLMQESDLHSRLRKNGYKLYFQPQAITYHREAESGGCSVATRRWRNYYYLVRNHSIFLVRIFGIKALYMIPCFLFYFVYGPLKFGAHWLKLQLKVVKSDQRRR
jgi:glycosyltransferase involved in cell wall biosynthesis